MSDINVQIKQNNGVTWDDLFPVTKAINVIEDSSHRFVTDAEKSSWNGKQASLGFTPENSANKNQPSGYAGLDSSGKLLDTQIPKIAITNTYTVNSQTAMLALTAEEGDIAIRTDVTKTFILSQSPASTLANWKELLTPVGSVSSVNGKTGAVTLDKSDIGLPQGVNLSVSSSEPTTFNNGDIWLNIV